MISLHAVSKWYKAGAETRTVFDSLNLNLPSDSRLGILGGVRSGKSVLLRLLAGLDEPSSGDIVRHAALSFPIGYARAFRPNVSGRETVYHAARLYGADPEEVMEVVASVSDLGAMLEEPMRRFPQTDRATLAYAISYALPFDTYLIDEFIAIGTPNFRLRCKQMFEIRAQSAGIILATNNGRKVKDNCTMVGVIVEKKLRLFDDVQEGIDVFERLELLGAE